MVERPNTAIERLELLSNTAVMKNVLDGNNSGGHLHEEKSKPSTMIANIHKPPSTARIPSPESYSNKERNQRGETPSPHTIADPKREAPPFPQDRSGHATMYPPHHQFHRLDLNVEGRPVEGALRFPPVMRTPSNHGYVQGPYGEMYFVDNPGVPPPAPLEHNQLAGSRIRGPYMLKENVPPPAFAGLPIYSSTRPNDSHFPRPADVPGRAVAYYPPPAVSKSESHDMPSQQPSYETLLRENSRMGDTLKEKDAILSTLQERVDYLESQISELRQLPTGKISHIPIDDMIRIMQVYGSEVSNQSLPKRKDSIKKASIVRQFRRWNPEFFRYFIHVNGEWVPKLGKEGELKRREEKRRSLKLNQGKSL